MKISHLFLGLGIILTTACSNNDKLEVGQRTTIEVSEEIEVGKIMKGEIAKATIEIKNTGKYPLIIAEAKGSCSCTVINPPTEPIPPGESVQIAANIKTDNAQPGPMVKTVNITANTQPSITQIKIKGKIIRK